MDRKVPGRVATDVAARATAISELIWNAEAPEDRFGAAHWILMIAAWYTALDRVQPLFSKRGDHVFVVDGWFYRNVAKSIIRMGVDEDWLNSLFASAVEPDVVVLLDVEPEVAWGHRTAFSDTELGRWDGHRGSPRDAFRGYQARVRREMVRMGEDRGWIRLRPDPLLTPSEVAEELVDNVFPDLRVAASGGLS